MPLRTESVIFTKEDLVALIKARHPQLANMDFQAEAFVQSYPDSGWTNVAELRIIFSSTAPLKGEK